jgi:hypothetical protein
MGHVRRGPVQRTVLGDGLERAREIAGRIGRAAPDVSLVEMGVRIDEEREHDAARQRRCRRIAEHAAAGWRDFRNASLIDQNIHESETVAVERR